jgi:hypothetical protein
MNILFEVTVLNGSNPVTLRMASAAASAEGCQLNNYQWTPLVTKRQNVSGSWASDGVFEQGSVNHGSLSFRMSAAYENENWSAYEWTGGLARIFIGNDGDPFASYKQVFEGSVSSLDRQANIATVGLLGPDALLERDLLSLEYQGTGNAEGQASLKGKLKPRALGTCLSVEPVLVDVGSQVYQVHGYGAVSSIQPYEYAQALDASKNKGDAPDYASLVAMTLVPGEWATCLNLGMFRFGGQPSKKVSADVTAGGASTVSAILSQLLALAGIPGARMGSFAAFSSASWSYYAADQVSIGELARLCAFQGGGMLFADGTGTWQVMDYFAPKAAVVINADRSSLPLVKNVRELTAAAPVYKVKIGYNRCWSVHSASDVSPALSDSSDKAQAALEAAEAAHDAAEVAAADAVIAKQRLDAIANDSILDRSEKADLIQRFGIATAERPGILNKGSDYNITTERSNYDAAYNALKNYLEALSPAYTDSTQDTAINRTDFDNAWKNYHLARQNLLNAIDGKAGTVATWGGVTGTGKPADNATVGAPEGTFVAGLPAKVVMENAQNAADAVKDANGVIKPVRDQIAESKRVIDAAVAQAQSDANKAQADLATARTALDGDVAVVRKAAADASAQAAQVRADLVPTITDAKKAGTDAAAEAAKVRTDLVPTITDAKKAGTDAAAIATKASTDLDAEIARAKSEEGTITTKVTAAQTRADGAHTAISTETTQRADGDRLLSQRIDTVESTATTDKGSLNTRITNEVATLVSADEAIGRRVDSVVTQANTDRSTAAAAVRDETTARTTAVDAVAKRTSDLETNYTSVRNDLGNWNQDRANEITEANARIGREETARSGADGALGQRIDTVVSQANSDRNATGAAIQSEATTRSDADGALGQRIDTVVSTANTDRTNNDAAIRDERTTRANDVSAVATRIGTLETSSQGAGNLLTNTDFPDTSGWRWISANNSQVIDSNGINYPSDDWHPAGENVLTLHQANGSVANGNTYTAWSSESFSVTPGENIQFYVFVANHRCYAGGLIYWLDAYGNNVGFQGTTGSVREMGGGRLTQDWDRVGFKSVQVPGNAQQAVVELRKYDTNPGEGDSWAWWWRPYVGAARAGQTTWNPYAPGSARAAIGKTNTRITDEATASSDRDRALGTRVDSVVTQANTDRSNSETAIRDERTARSDGDSSLGTRISTTEAKLNGGQDSWLAARIRDEATASADRDTAVANRASSLEATRDYQRSVLSSNDLSEEGRKPYGMDAPGTAFIQWEQNHGSVGWACHVRDANYIYFHNNHKITKQTGRRIRATCWFYSNTANYRARIYWNDNNGTEGRYRGEGETPAGEFNGITGATGVWTKLTSEITVGDDWYQNIYAIFNSDPWNGAGQVGGDFYVSGMIIEDVTQVAAANARITDLATVTSNATQAVANRTSSLETNFTGVRNDLNNWNNDRANQTIAVDARVGREETSRADGDSALGQRLNTVEASSRGAGNLVPNTDFATLSGWSITHNGMALNPLVTQTGDYWDPRGETVLQLTRGGTPGAGTFSEVQSAPFALTPNSYIQYYAFTSSHRSRSWASVFFRDENGNDAGYAGEQMAGRIDNGGPDLSGWDQTGKKSVRVPGNARFGVFVWRIYEEAQNTNPVGWLFHPYVGEARANQTEWNAYVVGSARKLIVDANARISDEATASATRDTALGNRVSSTEAKLNGGEDSWVAARIRDEATASATRDTALGTRISTTEATTKNVATSYTAVSRGNGAPTKFGKGAGIYNVDGANFTGGGRGWRVNVFDGANNLIASNLYDTLAGDRGFSLGGAGDMAGFLNGISEGQAVIITTDDEPRDNRLTGGLVEAMERCGAGPLFSSPNFGYRGAYILVGQAGIGKGNGAEYYSGTGDSAPDAWLERRFDLLNGRPVLNGMGKAVAETNAKLSDETTARTNADNAISGRVSTTEAKLNGDQDSTLAARIRDEATARANQDSAIAGRTDVLEVTARGTTTSAATNDKFANWPNASGYPTGWITWNSGGNYRIERWAASMGSPYAMRTLNDTAEVESGFYQVVNVHSGKWVVEVTAQCVANSMSGAGVTLHGQYNLDFMSDPDTNGLTGDQGDRIRTWVKMFDLSQDFVNSINGGVNFHAMLDWTGFNRYRAPKYVQWYRMCLRPAGPGDIAGAKNASDITEANARIGREETARADAVSAVGRRADTLEANYSTVRSNLDNWNNDRYQDYIRVDARVGREETARADAVSAVSNRTSVVEAQVSNDSNNLLRNGTFNAPGWVGRGAQGIPPYWGEWSNDGAGFRGASPRDSRYGANAPLQMDRQGINVGISQTLYNLAPGWYALEVDVTGEDGNWSGAGIHCNFNNGYAFNYGFAVNADTAGRTGDIGTANRQFTYLFYNGANTGAASFYIMSGWSGFQGGTDFGFWRGVYHRVVFRPATAGEIAARKVEDSNLVARVATTESAISNLNGKAAAYWQVQAVAGNGRAQMRVWADQTGGGGVDIVGDTTFKGNLDVGADGGGNRVKITNSGFQVFDGNGTLRAQFGLF